MIVGGVTLSTNPNNTDRLFLVLTELWAREYSPGCPWSISYWSSGSWVSCLWLELTFFMTSICKDQNPHCQSQNSISSQWAAFMEKKPVQMFPLLPVLECVLVLLLEHVWVLHSMKRRFSVWKHSFFTGSAQVPSVLASYGLLGPHRENRDGFYRVHCSVFGT